jgi:hypothetical protein
MGLSLGRHILLYALINGSANGVVRVREADREMTPTLRLPSVSVTRETGADPVLRTGS